MYTYMVLFTRKTKVNFIYNKYIYSILEYQIKNINMK